MTEEVEVRHNSLDAAGIAHAREGDGAAVVRRPYRGVPRNFRDLWPQVGWSGAEMEWHAHARTISRWLDECGRDEMILARKAYKEAQRAIAGRARRKRYVMGRTLTPMTEKPPRNRDR